MTRRFRRTFLLGVSVALLLSEALAVPAGANTSGTLTISTDTTLTENHDGNIIVGTDGVTLDCGGHSVTGAGAGVGILLDGRAGVTVRNCEVTNFLVAIKLVQADGNTLSGNSAHHNAAIGIGLFESDGNILTGNAATSESGRGFSINGSDDNELAYNSASGNVSGNFVLLEIYGVHGAKGNTFSYNTAAGPGLGFWIGSSLGGFDVAGNTFHANTSGGTSSGGGGGFSVTWNAHDNVFTDNRVLDTWGDGFTIFAGNTGNIFTGNGAYRTGSQRSRGAGWGFREYSAQGDNVYSNNICLGNRWGPSTPAGLCDRGFAGANRFSTAAAIATSQFDPGVEVAYIATGSDFPDALAGSPVAGRNGGPILFAGSIPGPTATELTRLRPKKIVIMGAPARCQTRMLPSWLPSHRDRWNDSPERIGSPRQQRSLNRSSLRGFRWLMWRPV